jgi:dTDP-4-amino-4,6-dideoxygalactose transaminase
MYKYGDHFLDKKDSSEVLKSLKSDLLTTGKYVKRLEEKVKKKLHVKNVITCNSGTSAIYLSLVAINLKKNDKIIIPSINFTAAASLCKILGAKIYFADVDPVSYQLSKKTLLECLRRHKIKKIKAVFTMSLGGSSKHQKEIFQLKTKLKFKLIEDSCHALGGTYSKSKILVGSCKYSDIATFSLHPVKTITSGEGGLICTNNKKIARRIEILRSHGIIKRKKYIYDVQQCSFNFRLSDINCALAFSQLDKMNNFIEKRRKIAAKYAKNFKKYPNLIRIINVDDIKFSAWHLLIIEINKKSFNKISFYDSLVKKKIYPQLHYIPTYRFSAFKKENNVNYKLINHNSEKYFKNCISLPIYYNLKLKEVDHISKTVLANLLK